MNRITKLIAALVIILISSCKVSYKEVQVLDPAQINIPAEIRSFAIINRLQPKEDESRFRAPKPVDPQELTISEFAAKCAKKVAEELIDSPRFNKVVFGGSEDKGKISSGSQLALGWDRVEDLCRKNRVAAVYSLESLEYNQIQLSEKINNTSDAVSKSFIISSHWRLYDPYRKRYFDESVFLDTVILDNKLFEKTITLTDSDSASIATARIIGKNHAARLTPYYFMVKRNYYKKGNEKLENAAEYVEKGEWLAAASIWKRMAYEEKDSTLASYASYNMAVAEEIIGRLPIALSWARKSNKLIPKNSTLKYINILNKRVLDLDK